MAEFVHIFVDGGSRGNPGPSACAFVIPKFNRSGAKFLGSKTNNEAEYCAVLFALHYAKFQGWKRIHIFSDSQIVVRQWEGVFAIREPRMQRMHDALKLAIEDFENVVLSLIKRKRNHAADALCNKELNQHDQRKV